MTSAGLRVLVADDEVSDLLVMKRLLRETPYAVDTVRSASQAIEALANKTYAAVIVDEERLSDMTGAQLLAHVEKLQPTARRILLAQPEHADALRANELSGRYQVIARPFFARPLVASLLELVVDSHSRREDQTEKTITHAFIQARADEADSMEAARPRPGRMAHRRVLLTLAELVEAHAGHASGHGARVSALAGLLGVEAGLKGEELESVEDAALVHDVGELALDEKLLREPRPLTERERVAVRRHVESSFQIVRRAALAPSVLAAVKHHHERFCGDGYPDGLVGDAIPIAARVVAVADTWDALATDRPYRRAVPLDRCVAELRALAGTQLDPALVASYLDKKLYDLIDWSDPPRPGAKLL
jgi:response regulator RpfG family c-di-GMP phosphodiesterase